MSKKQSVKFKPTSKFLLGEYIVRDKTRKQIAKENKTTLDSVNYWLGKYKIKKLDDVKAKFNTNLGKPISCKLLRREYFNKTVAQIKKKYNFSESKIRKGLKRCGIKKPAGHKSGLYSKFKSEEALEEALIQLYCIEGLSVIQVAEKLGTTYTSIINLLKHFGIQIDPTRRWTKRRDFTKLKSIRKNSMKNMEKLFSEVNKERNKTQPPCSAETKLKISEGNIEAHARKELNEGEKKTRKILNELVGKKKILEHVVIKIFRDEKYFKGYNVDFLFKITGVKKGRKKWLVVLEVDGKYPHHFKEIIKKDKKENVFLTSMVFMVIRIDPEDVSAENISKCIDTAKNLSYPKLIILNGGKITTEKLLSEKIIGRCEISALCRKTGEMKIVDNFIFN